MPTKKLRDITFGEFYECCNNHTCDECPLMGLICGVEEFITPDGLDTEITLPDEEELEDD